MSIFYTKNLFHKTFISFKSFISCLHYPKLPKFPHSIPDSTTAPMTNNRPQKTRQEFEQFYADFTNKWDFNRTNDVKKRCNYKKMDSTTTTTTTISSTTRVLSFSSSTNHPPKQEKVDLIHNGSFMQFLKANTSSINNQMKKHYDSDESYKIKKVNSSCSSNSSTNVRETKTQSRKNYSVVKNVRELKVIDLNNVDHVLDIEEALYYYGHLTCPAYLDIVDKFFSDIYEECFYQARNTRQQRSNQ